MRIGTIEQNGKKEIIFDGKEGIILLSDLKVTDNIGSEHSLREMMSNETYMGNIRKKLDDYKGDFLSTQENEMKFLPAIGYPEKIICVGLNYYSHVREAKLEVPEYPTLFSKFNNSLSAHNEEIPVPTEVKQLDYEGELGIVIGKTARNVPQDEALNYVFGYFASNDLSARDLQFRTKQWLLGKTSDGFYPNGPFIVTADEVDDPNNLGLKTYVNGELRQNSNTSQMIFNCENLVSYVSSYMTLRPGDVISTGTPEGVIRGMPKEKQVWIKRGDKIEVEIDDVGKLSNTIF